MLSTQYNIQIKIRRFITETFFRAIFPIVTPLSINHRSNDWLRISQDVSYLPATARAKYTVALIQEDDITN